MKPEIQEKFNKILRTLENSSLLESEKKQLVKEINDLEENLDPSLLYENNKKEIINAYDN